MFDRKIEFNLQPEHKLNNIKSKGTSLKGIWN